MRLLMRVLPCGWITAPSSLHKEIGIEIANVEIGIVHLGVKLASKSGCQWVAYRLLRSGLAAKVSERRGRQRVTGGVEHATLTLTDTEDRDRERER